ncbi:Nucleolysin TIAR [Gryllus bimaculatus]|nr:Nucleolysin TIAR [Gryllus bimaculatus]
MATVYMSEFADDETPASFDYGDSEIMSEESHPRTLYVGNLDASVSEDLVCALFSQIGPVKGCKIIRESSFPPHPFRRSKLSFSLHFVAEFHNGDGIWVILELYSV